MKKDRLILIAIGIVFLFVLTILGLLFSFLFDPHHFLNWKAFVIPLGVWTILMAFYIMRLKLFGNKKYDQKLASSTWMDKITFKHKFPNFTEKSNFPAHWITKTALNQKSKLLHFNQSQLDSHALVIGSTGSGKTSLLLNATINLFAKANDSPSMILSDPKGELFATHSQYLANQGYEVISINLRDYQKSWHWNPLGKIWDLWFSETDQEFKREKALNYLSELTSTIFPSNINNNQDNFFDEAAFSVFQFFVILYLEKVTSNPKLTKECFNINNIVSNINQTTFDDLQIVLDEIPKDSLALMVGGMHIKGSDKTVTNILQTVVTKLKIYSDPVIKRITANTNIKIDTKKAQAIFIIVPDESRAKYPFISLFIAEFYKELIALASLEINHQLKQKFYFLLDEFGNIPKIENMEAMITVARSRNIFFMLLIQNYSQLNAKYGNHNANTIISNCGLEYFLLTSDVDTAKKFSQKLGHKSLIAKSKSHSSNVKGASSSSSESERTRALIHPDELMRLNFGEFVLSLQREKPIKSSLAKLWTWKNFITGKLIIKNKIIDQYQSKHTINFLTPENDNYHQDFLKNLNNSS